MLNLLHHFKLMDLAYEAIGTLTVLVLALETFSTFATISIAVLAGFYWVLRIRKMIQEDYFNSLLYAIKTLFRRHNRYGGRNGINEKKTNSKKD